MTEQITYRKILLLLNMVKEMNCAPTMLKVLMASARKYIVGLCDEIFVMIV